MSGSAAIAGTAVGLDVHDRSTVAWALDGLIGEVVAEHLVPDTAAVVGWLEWLPGPVAVAYEADSTGFGRVAGGTLLRIFVFSTSKTATKGDRTCRRGREAPRSGGAGSGITATLMHACAYCWGVILRPTGCS